MKTFLASLAFTLCLTLPIQADELSLGETGAPPATISKTGSDAPARDATNARVHLGLDRHEQNDSLVCELPAVQTISSATEPPTITVTPNWNKPDAVQILTPGATAAPVQPMATLAPVLPAGSAVGSGVVDSWMYGGVAMLLLALVWVCRAAVRQGGAAKPWSPGGEVVREARAQRVKMVALKV